MNKRMSYIESLKNEKEELEFLEAKLDVSIINLSDFLSKEEYALAYHQKKCLQECIRTLDDRIYLAEMNKENFKKGDE